MLGKTISEILSMQTDSTISADEMFNYFINRIDTYDSKINSYLYVNKFSSDHSASEGLLKGIPIAVKDLISTNGIKTTAGSKVLDNYVPPYNATIIEKLYKAGAFLLGKTNLDAWAHGSSTETSDYGTTKNPYDITRLPGGSSGGSAAAVASYLAPVAIGTDTGGSIRHPSAWCGVVGLRPTYGRVSRYGVIAMASSWDCPGPIAATVEDCARILQVIAGKDRYDATTHDSPVPDYLSKLKDKKIYTIGISDEYFENVDDEIKNAIQNVIDMLSKKGHKVKKVKLLSPKYAVSVYMILQRSEVSSNLARYDGIRFGNNRSYFGSEAERRIMLGTYSLSHGYYDAYYKKAQKVRTIIVEDFKSVFNEVDVIISPSTPISALKLGSSEEYSFFGETMDILNEPVSAAGIPAISIPIGFDTKNLPIGMQIIAPTLAEEKLLNCAYQIEQEVQFDRISILKNTYV